MAFPFRSGGTGGVTVAGDPRRLLPGWRRALAAIGAAWLRWEA
jgi:hypothetical protein